MAIEVSKDRTVKWNFLTIEELKKFRNEVLSMAVEPPWCENVETLKKWIEGFEMCQHEIIVMIDSKIKNVDQQR